MTKASVNLQDLRRRIYVKAKSEPEWRFWGLFVHACKMETLEEACKLAKENNGAPEIDGVTFDQIEEQGRQTFLTQLQEELEQETYRPLPNRRKEVPKANDKVRVLVGIPAIRDRVVQGALRLVIETIFEADFQDGSYGYRPKRSLQEAIQWVAVAIAEGKTIVIDLDLKAYFDNVRHHILLKKITARINDADIMKLTKKIFKTSGKKGLPQGGTISPLFSNIYLNEVDKMLEKAKEKTRQEPYTKLEYAGFADDKVVLVNWHPCNKGLVEAVQRRIKEELDKLQVELNEDIRKVVDLTKGESFTFLIFEFRQSKSRNGKWRPHYTYTPQQEKRKKLLKNLQQIFAIHQSWPIREIIEEINPRLRGHCNYYRFGYASRHFSYIRWWVNRRVRRNLQRVRGFSGFGWKKWSSAFIYGNLGLVLYCDYMFKRYQPAAKPA